MIPDVSWNVWPVVVSALASVVLGAIWYSPMFFGKILMGEKGFKGHKKDKQSIGKNFLLVFVGWLLSGYVLAHLAIYATATNFFEGAQVGFWIWLGFVVPFFMGDVLWEGKSWADYLVNVGYYLIALCLQAAIIVVWG